MSGERVLIADDHPPTRAGVRDALEAGGFVVVAEVGRADTAVEAALEQQPDVCLLDIRMPGSGITAAEQICSQLPGTPVVMLTVSTNDDDLFAALRAGALGYLLKGMDPDRLPDALRGAMRGEAALAPHLTARLIDEFRARGSRRIPLPGRRAVELSGREWEVLAGLREGLSTKEIAERMSVAPVTVRTHVAALLRKLRVKDRDAAIRLFDEA